MTQALIRSLRIGAKIAENGEGRSIGEIFVHRLAFYRKSVDVANELWVTHFRVSIRAMSYITRSTIQET